MLLPSESPNEGFDVQEGCTCFEVALGLRSSVRQLQWQGRSGLLAITSQGAGASTARIDVIDPAWPQVASVQSWFCSHVHADRRSESCRQLASCTYPWMPHSRSKFLALPGPLFCIGQRC